MTWEVYEKLFNKWKTRQIKSHKKTFHYEIILRKIFYMQKKIIYMLWAQFYFLSPPMLVDSDSSSHLTCNTGQRRVEKRKNIKRVKCAFYANSERKICKQFCLRQKETLISKVNMRKKCKIIFQHFTCEREGERKKARHRASFTWCYRDHFSCSRQKK